MEVERFKKIYVPWHNPIRRYIPHEVFCHAAGSREVFGIVGMLIHFCINVNINSTPKTYSSTEDALFVNPYIPQA
jgi:hypothetical protein